MSSHLTSSRYAGLLARWRERLERGRVLEIGRGQDGGLARRLGTGVTLLHPSPAPDCGDPPVLRRPLTRTGLEDGAFDYVVCLDVLQHIDPRERAAALAEWTRLARRACFIAAPHAPYALDTLEQAAVALGRGGVGPPTPPEHALPWPWESLAALLAAGGRPPAVTVNESCLQHLGNRLLDGLGQSAARPGHSGWRRGFQDRPGEIQALGVVENDLPWSLLFTLDKEPPPAGRPAAADPFGPALDAPVRDDAGPARSFCVFHDREPPLGRGRLLEPLCVRPHARFAGIDAPEGFFERENDRCSEMSAIHYVWRRRLHGAIVGFCHYRRYLHLDPAPGQLNETPLDANGLEAQRDALDDPGRLEALMAGCDLLVRTPLAIRPPGDRAQPTSVYAQYVTCCPARDYLACVSVMLEDHPWLRPAVLASMSAPTLYHTNLFYCRAPLFEAFCGLWFDILGRTAQRIDVSGRTTYQRRDIGFLSERVFDVLVRHLLSRGARVRTLPTVFLKPDGQ